MAGRPPSHPLPTPSTNRNAAGPAWGPLRLPRAPPRAPPALLPSLTGRWARPGGRQHSRCRVACIRPLGGVFFGTGPLLPRRTCLLRRLNWLLAVAAGGGLLFLSPGRLRRQSRQLSTGPPRHGGRPPQYTRIQPHGSTMESAPGGSQWSPMSSRPASSVFPPQQHQACRLPATAGGSQDQSLSPGRWGAEQSGPDPHPVCLLPSAGQEPPAELGSGRRRWGVQRSCHSIPSPLHRRGYSHSSLLSILTEAATTQKRWGHPEGAQGKGQGQTVGRTCRGALTGGWGMRHV